MTDLVIRTATEHDAEAMFALINAHLSEGHLLPREINELRRHADRFLVACLPSAEGASHSHDIVACAELAPLSARVAEVRSLVVSRDVRGVGLASRMVSVLSGRMIQSTLPVGSMSGSERPLMVTLVALQEPHSAHVP